ncbi:hypothetical protein J7E71_13215 [Mesobacillus foraminis]|uniref:hypothetical protein n=1 Tax=Mesobacillus foraminis TaxID=279826 RepID=UPI001BE68BE6|nr:hypothetical protein [Mesobacillus foraminis]MBT2756903.1 hypothetical protein [Mesobacillus foraminis]
MDAIIQISLLVFFLLYVHFWTKMVPTLLLHYKRIPVEFGFLPSILFVGIPSYLIYRFAEPYGALVAIGFGGISFSIILILLFPIFLYLRKKSKLNIKDLLKNI